MLTTTEKTQYMQRAINLAKKGLYTVDPNPCVGCIIVKNNQIVGEGWHRQAGQAHAEVNALAQAKNKAKNATVFVTLEPCHHTGKTPPCSQALIKAGVKEVIIAMMDPNPQVQGKGINALNDAHIKTELGLLENEAKKINIGFIKRMQSQRPFVRVKMAMSLDGRTAMASGESQWISGNASREKVQFLRAQSSAILTGIDTIIADNPSLNVRLSAKQLNLAKTQSPRQPKRFILDSKLKMPNKAKILSLEGETLVFTTKKIENANDYPYKIETIDAENTNDDNKRINLKALMHTLAEKEINLLHVEAGSVLTGALLNAKLVDEIILFIAPHIMGDGAKGLFHLPDLKTMDQRIKLNISDIRQVGTDICISAQPDYCAK